MSTQFLETLSLKNFLSFGPMGAEVRLAPLNVLIGPNGSGKTNFLEAFELLRATPGDLADPIRFGGGAEEWLWKGKAPPEPACISTRLWLENVPELRYSLEFTHSQLRLELVREVLENALPSRPGNPEAFFYYRYNRGKAEIVTREASEAKARNSVRVRRTLRQENLSPEQSVFYQRRDPDLYPEITRVGQRFDRIQTFREWGFGRTSPVRKPTPANLPNDELLPTVANLGLVLNDLQHSASWPRYEQYLQRFLPRFRKLSTKVQAGAVQVFLHEEGLESAIPATRLSDGTLRFLALLAVLLRPESVPLVCIEEPELGLHPDALALVAELLLEARTKTQLIVTTHSEVLVSALTEQAESVLVTEHSANGTVLRRLESDKLKHWLSKYRLGEIWRIGKLGGNLW